MLLPVHTHRRTHRQTYSPKTIFGPSDRTDIDMVTNINHYRTKARNVRKILVRGSMPPCRLRRKFDYEIVHSGVYLNKYVVSIAA